MPEEVDKPRDILEKIPPHDKEVILLAPIYFFGKYVRRNVNSKDFKPVIPKFDPKDPFSIIRIAFSINRQANSDIEGDAPSAISEIITKHPMRNQLFPNLKDTEISNICWELDNIFENQEYCAQCESWSLYDTKNPEEFAINASEAMLWLCGGNVGIPWFARISLWKDREIIIKKVLKEKLSSQLHKFLPVGKFEKKPALDVLK